LPVWQEVRRELHPQGVEVVTVALDVGGADAAGAFIDAAAPDHPSLIDREHRLTDLLGIVNVPSGIWIDEDGVIVRPPETAYPGHDDGDWLGDIREQSPDSYYAPLDPELGR